jgi:serine/threonine protein kinase/tetratricopeptide (TPR) repeat protein
MRERDIFIEALQKADPAVRSAYLDAACADDDELRERVQRLLAAHEKNESFFLDAAAPRPGDPASGTVEQSVTESPSTVIGPYQLIKPIGEGGMGVVWMAQQTAPVKRVVALKLIKAGMDSKQVIARFEAERQALALMDHPNIARVLDGGTTGGRPYFVMDLVKGVPITMYCDEHHLTPRQRLELFLPVCQAVQHAHQKGIIHRDLKPSNVLVALYDGNPVPKVIDFGVAKAAGKSLTGKTLVTGFGAIVGTLEYMSPEQAEVNQLDIDTRSDIYSLGVLLYELLTGSPPFTRKELERAGMLEMLRVIREQEPSKPSTKLSTAEGLPTLAANRGTEPAKLTKLVRGEPDWIVMKALEKDRNRRYDTANSLAMDVQRYLADEPVEACPPSNWYQMRKFVRRNRGPVLAVGLTLGVLLAGVVGTTLGLIEARRQRDLAEKAEAAARDDQDAAVAAEASNQAVQDFLVRHVLMAARPYGSPGGLGIDVTVTQALAAAEPEIGRVFARQPRAEASARYAIGVTWLNQGRFPQAEAHFLRAAELWTDELGPDARETLLARHSLGEVLAQTGRYPEAVALLHDTLRRMQSKLGADSPDTLATVNDLAAAQFAAGDREHARAHFAEMVRLRKDCHLQERPLQLTQYMAAWAAQAPEQLSATVALRKEIVQAHQAELGPNHPDTLVSMNNLAVEQTKASNPREAIRIWEQILPIQRSNPGPDHLDTLTTAANLGWAYFRGGDPRKASSLLEHVWDKRQVLLGSDHPDTLTSMLHLGIAYVRAGKNPKAIALLEQCVKLHRSRFGPNHLDTTHSMSTLAYAYLQSGRVPDAIELAEQVLVLQQTSLGPAHPDTLNTQHFLAWAYQRDGKRDRFLSLLEERLRLSRAKWGENHAHTLTCLHDLAVACRQNGERDRAIALWEEAVKLRTTTLGPKAPGTLDSRRELLKALADRAQSLGAKSQWDKACADLVRVHEGNSDDLEGTVIYAGALLLAGNSEEYKRLCARLLESDANSKSLDKPGRKSYLLARICLFAPAAVADVGGPLAMAEQVVAAQPRVPWYLHTLGLAEYRAGRFDVAVKHLEESMRSDPAWAAQSINWLTLAMAHYRLGHAEEACQWLVKAEQAGDKDRSEKSRPPNLGMHVHDWIAYLILRREAENLLKGGGP